MIRFALPALFLLGISFLQAATPDPGPAPLPPVDPNHLPWGEGESLTCLISMGGFEAAEGTFVARQKNDRWEFKLSLASRGLVDDFYPFTGYFWSSLTVSPWRSYEYGEYRFEPRRTVKERTRVDYARHQATREMWGEGKSKTFPITEDSVDDVGTMLYHLRTGSWKPGDKRTLFVYEDSSEKQADVECQARENRSFGTWPRQPVIRLLALPGKGTRHRGSLMVWMTDDARHLPLHAELDFRYGSVSIDLTKDGKAPPLKPE